MSMKDLLTIYIMVSVMLTPFLIGDMFITQQKKEKMQSELIQWEDMYYTAITALDQCLMREENI
jgi:hypothetical protein